MTTRRSRRPRLRAPVPLQLLRPALPTLGVRTLLLAALLLSALPAAALDTGSEHDPGADFSTYRTYDWEPVSSTARPPGHPLATGNPLDREIRSAVEARLAKKGLERVTTGGADLLLRYDAALEEGLEVSGSEYRADAGGVRVTWAWEGGEEARVFSRGTLVLQMIDADSREVVWVGWASDVAADPDALRRKVDRAAKKILKSYPPRRR